MAQGFIFDTPCPADAQAVVPRCRCQCAWLAIETKPMANPCGIAKRRAIHCVIERKHLFLVQIELFGAFMIGIPTGRVTYGYRRVNNTGTWRIEESEARRVRYAFNQAAKGICYKDIRAGLDRMEMEENTGVSWSKNRKRLTALLRHMAYKGDYMTDCYYTTYGKNGKRYSKLNKGECIRIHLEDHHEPIVSREQFERVQTLIQMGLLDSGRCRFTEEGQVSLPCAD